MSEYFYAQDEAEENVRLIETLDRKLAAALERVRVLQMDSECLRIASEKLGCDKSDVVRMIENQLQQRKW